MSKITSIFSRRFIAGDPADFSLHPGRVMPQETRGYLINLGFTVAYVPGPGTPHQPDWRRV